MGFIMGKITLFILLLTMSVGSAFAQSASRRSSSTPSWVSEEQRARQYPSAMWHIGFTRDRVNGRPDFQDYQSIEMRAQQDLSERIMTEVRSSSALRTQTIQRRTDNNFTETTIDDFDVNVIIQSNAVLVNVERHSFFDRKSGTIYGFAAVRKSVLADFYKSNMNTLFSFADGQFNTVATMVENGRKIAALEKTNEIADTLQRIAEFNTLLLAVNNDNSFVENIVNIRGRLNNTRAQIQSGTKVFLEISGDNNLSELSAIIPQSEDWNFVIVENKEQADYQITIKTELSRCTPPDVRLAFCHANADVSVKNLRTQRNVNVQISEARGGFPNADTDRATQVAFRNLTNDIAQKVIQTIKEVFFR